MRQPDSLTLLAPDVSAMRSIGFALAEALSAIEAPFVIELHGELGAGKTTLVGAVLNRMGFSGSAKSPTYTLIESYEFAERDVYHLDLYRLTDPREVDALGLRDLLIGRALLLIEWPERGGGELPPADLRIHLSYQPVEGRQLTFGGLTNAGRDVLLRVTAAAKP